MTLGKRLDFSRLLGISNYSEPQRGVFIIARLSIWNNKVNRNIWCGGLAENSGQEIKQINKLWKKNVCAWSKKLHTQIHSNYAFFISFFTGWRLIMRK